MHLMLGRREDRLLFDYQNTLAAQYGFESTPAKRASEQLMQGYYRNAKAIVLANTILMQNIGAALSRAWCQGSREALEAGEDHYGVLDRAMSRVREVARHRLQLMGASGRA